MINEKSKLIFGVSALIGAIILIGIIVFSGGTINTQGQYYANDYICNVGEPCKWYSSDCATQNNGTNTGELCKYNYLGTIRTGYCCRLPVIPINTTVDYICNVGEPCKWASGDCAVQNGGINTGERCKYTTTTGTYYTGYCCKLPITSNCTAGYVCNNTNRCYRDTNCVLTSCSNCTYGCNTTTLNCNTAPELTCNTGEACRWAQADCAYFNQTATGARCHTVNDAAGASTGYCCKSPTCTAGLFCNGTYQCNQASNCTVSCVNCSYGCDSATNGCLFPPTCSDPDKSIATYGECASVNVNIKDFCINNVTLSEAYCSTTGCAYMNYTCTAYNYTYCSGGRCTS